MRDFKSIIESSKSPEEIFESINEKTAAGNIPRTGDYIRLLDSMNGFEKGDEVEVVSFVDTSNGGNMDSFNIGVKGTDQEGKSATLSFERGDIDKKFQMVYDS